MEVIAMRSDFIGREWRTDAAGSALDARNMVMKGMGGRCLMMNAVRLNYDLLQSQYCGVMEYLFATSDVFSVVAELKKPYTKIPPNVRQNRFAERLKDDSLAQITDARQWPEDVELHGKHKVLLTFRACKQAMEIVREEGNLFNAPENGLPEDVCFFRSKRVWFATLTHEHMAFAFLDTPEDAEFFRVYIK